MIARAAAALAVSCLLLQPCSAQTNSAAAHQHWVSANEKAIARIRDPKKRAARRATFAITQRLANPQTAPALQGAPDASARAAKILSNHRLFAFGVVQKPPPKTWWERLSDWFSERWSAAMKALFSRVHLSGKTSIAIGDILLVLSILAFLALAGRLLWLYGPRSSSAGMNARALQDPEDPMLLYSRALDAARQGDYRTGVAFLFAASLVSLGVRSVLHDDAAKTIGELRRNVRRMQPQASAPFDRIAAALTLAIYADAPIDAGHWDSALAAYAALQTDGPAHAS